MRARAGWPTIPPEYDALLLKCAAKVKAKTIYTWNLKHFLAIDPRQASRIRTH
jgi:predicted nucleic acid-binding protein